MGVDITTQFRNCVQMRKNQNKMILGTATNEKVKPHVRRRDPYVLKCKEIVSRITELKDFLMEHRKSYLSLGPEYLRDHGPHMSDVERDKVDSGAQSIIKVTSHTLTDLKRNLYEKEDCDQASDVHKAIADLLEMYLKSVTKIFTEMKAIRVKWTVEVQKMSKFEAEQPRKDDADSIKREDRKLEGSSFSHSASTYSYDDDSQISVEEMQMFQMENDHLYNELNSLNDEVKSIQSKVVKIAELQEVFTEKVLEQNEDIERISSTLVGTTENLKDANSQIRQAIQSNANFRIYVLFFILMMSFTLLFLDWYND